MDPRDEVTQYEELVQSRGSLEDHINLALACWQATDPGVAAAYHLSAEFMNVASQRWRTSLEQARSKYPGRTEPELWKKYIEFLENDGGLTPSEIEAMERREPNDLTTFFLYMISGAQELVGQCQKLLLDCESAGDPRRRYVASVLRSVLPPVHDR